MVDVKAFGSRLRLLREERGMNQVALARDLSVANSTISQYEMGNRLPDAHALNKLAIYFDVSINFLLCLTDTRQERRQAGDRRRLYGGWVNEQKDEIDYEVDGGRMIGPELAYSDDLEGAAQAAGKDAETGVLEIVNTAPTGDVAAILNLAPGENALKITQIQSINGIPSRIMTSWMPADLFVDIFISAGKPPLERLKEVKGIYAVKVEERIRTSALTDELAGLLKTEPGECALEIQRVVHGDIGRVLELSFITAVGRLWELAYTYAAGGRVSAPDWPWLPKMRKQVL